MMEPIDLALECKRVIELGGTYVTLKVRHRKGCPERIRLRGRNSPLGRWIGNVDATRSVASFKAIDVLAWLAENGLVEEKH